MAQAIFKSTFHFYLTQNATKDESILVKRDPTNPQEVPDWVTETETYKLALKGGLILVISKNQESETSKPETKSTKSNKNTESATKAETK